MENRVHIFKFSAETVNNGTDSVRNSAEEKEGRSCKTEGSGGRFPWKYNAPAHNEIAYHGEHLIFFKVYRS